MQEPVPLDYQRRIPAEKALPEPSVVLAVSMLVARMLVVAVVGVVSVATALIVLLLILRGIYQFAH